MGFIRLYAVSLFLWGSILTSLPCRHSFWLFAQSPQQTRDEALRTFAWEATVKLAATGRTHFFTDKKSDKSYCLIGMAFSLSVVENQPFAVFANFLAKNLLLSGPSERCCLLVGRSWVLQSQYLKQDLKQWHSEKDQWRIHGRGSGNPARPPIFRPK